MDGDVAQRSYLVTLIRKWMVLKKVLRPWVLLPKGISDLNSPSRTVPDLGI